MTANAIALLVAGQATALGPVTIQGRLTSAGGEAVDGKYGVAVSVYAQETGGVPLHTHVEPAITVVDGVFSLRLNGPGPVPAGVFDTGAGQFVGLAVAGEPELPRIAVGLVPYAIRAEVAGGLTCTGCITTTQLASDVTAQLESLQNLADVAYSGAYSDLDGAPASAQLGTSCPTGEVVSGLGLDGALICRPAVEPTLVFRFPVAEAPPLACDSSAVGAAYVSATTQRIFICNGLEWYPLSIATIGTAGNPGASCKDILQKSPTSTDGVYWIKTANVATTVYCDMTTGGGGWTLVSYAYRAQSGGSEVYYLPNAAQGVWDPAARGGKGAINATQLLQGASQLALTVTNGGAQAVAGNLKSYGLAYTWAKATGYDRFGFDLSTTSCIDVNITELNSGATFSAKTFANRPQVSCSGHAGGTGFERQFIGFNSATCYGACGSDPTNSNGMVVWYGDGYDPTTSGGLSDPERAASFGFWIR